MEPELFPPPPPFKEDPAVILLQCQSGLRNATAAGYVYSIVYVRTYVGRKKERKKEKEKTPVVSYQAS